MDARLAGVTTSPTTVTVPVVLDLQGSLSRATMIELSEEGLALVADLVASKGTTVSIQFCFAKDFAYMNLPGVVSSVLNTDSSYPLRWRIEIEFSTMTETERAILRSCVSTLHGISPLQGISNGNGHLASAQESPMSVISLFLTDNPHALHYQDTLARSQAQTTRSPKMTWTDVGPGPCSSSIPTLSQPRLGLRLLIETIGLVLQVMRDALVLILPPLLARLLVQRVDFAFIVHPRDLSDIVRKFPAARFLPLRLVDRWLRRQWPCLGAYLFGTTRKDGRRTVGAILISPLTTEQMIRNPRLARRRVTQTVKLAGHMGAQIVGLGAFTSIVTRDGTDFEGPIQVGVTTGNAHSAAIAVQNVLTAAALTNLSLPHATAAIVGGAGSVGSACAKLLAPLVNRLILIDIKKKELEKLLQELRGRISMLQGTSDIGLVREADVVIVATNSPATLISSEHVKAGTIVIDAAQPKNVSEHLPLQRPDVLVIESAIVTTPGLYCHGDRLDVGADEAMGCMSEAMILASIEWQGHYSQGKADPQQAAEITKLGRQLGFRLAPFRNSTGYITQEDLVRVAKSRKAGSFRA